MNGRQFLHLLRRLDRHQLDMPARTLIDIYDEPRCDDCGAHHDNVYEALACDDYTDARRRRRAARAARRTRNTRPKNHPDQAQTADTGEATR